ncbi:MAG: hypothetical protein J5803_03035, partial [Desulfovibrio sp.]|nr:hypothetical protein [Desulfovibrio sp.]
MSFSFNEDYYIASKLAQLAANHETDSNGTPYIATTLRQAIHKAHMTVKQHYDRYATKENTSANSYFNTQEYLNAKLAQLNSTHEGNKTWTMSMLKQALQKVGLTAESHYHKYGSFEYDADGKLINPSNAFDANAYVAAKLAQLQATDQAHWGNKTAKDVVNAIHRCGMDIVEHYERYGAKEANAAEIAMAQTVPVVDRVANDPLRAISGENVPTNYNPSTKAPYDVKIGTAVPKPQDMGGLASESISPKVIKPENPIPTPSDTEYVPVTNGGITDTNENAVALISATVLNSNGTPITLSVYGRMQSDGKTGTAGNETKTYFPLKADGTIDSKAKAAMTITKDASGTTKTDITIVDAKGNSISETQLTNAEGTTTEITTKATFTDGTTLSSKGTSTTQRNGAVTTNSEENIKNPDGTTSIVKSSVTTQRNDDGSLSTDSTVETGDTKSMTLEIVTKETVTTKADGSRHSVISTSTKDAQKIVVTANATSDQVRAADGTLTDTISTTTKNADGSTTYEARTEISKYATDGTTNKTISINAHTNDSTGKQIGTESGTINIETKATGAVNAAKDLTYVDAKTGTVTHDTTTSRYDPIKNETITTKTLSTTDSTHTTPKVETDTITTKGDSTESITKTDVSQVADTIDTHPNGEMTLALSQDGLTISGTLKNFDPGDDTDGTMSITLTPDTGATQTIFTARYTVAQDGKVTWSSNDPKNLTIDDKGNITVANLPAGSTYDVTVSLKDSDDYTGTVIGSAKDYDILSPITDDLSVGKSKVSVSESGLPNGTESSQNTHKAAGQVTISGTPTDIKADSTVLFQNGAATNTLTVPGTYGVFTFTAPGTGPLQYTYTLTTKNSQN